MHSLLTQSKEILEKAIADYSLFASVLMFSGGNDSRLAYWVLKAIGYSPDAIIHGHTGTGIAECRQFVESFAAANDERLIIADYGAGEAYRARLLDRGWFGRGQKAHSIAYNILKATPFRKAISHNFRHGKRGRNVLMICGARQAESINRADNYSASYYNSDPASPGNIWVNLVWHWPDKEKREFLAEQPGKAGLFPSTLHRSGDCMCGTTQSIEEGSEAAFWFPDWANEWWLPTRRAVAESGCTWDWGQNPPAGLKAQLPLFRDFMPACITCQRKLKEK